MATKPRNAAHDWAAFALVVGLGLSLWALVGLRPQLPEQDPAIVGSADLVEQMRQGAEALASGDPAAPTEIESQSASEGANKTWSAASSGEAWRASAAALYVVGPAVGDKIGTISLPSLELSWAIYHGTEEAQLSKGVGHYTGSVLPGVSDNSILSGHRTTVFNRLGELVEGDLILVRTSAGLFTYKVLGFRVVDRSDQNVIMPSDGPMLTLTTCYPFNALGATTDAFIVSAELIAADIR
jgi:sortase A